MSYRILLVDDEPDILEFVGFNLTKEGFDVSTAPNGLIAIEKARKTLPHLVLLDVMMPEMDGMEFLQAYREGMAQQNTEEAPVVVITGHGSVDTAVESLKGGAFDFIQKPLDLNRLLWDSIQVWWLHTEAIMVHSTTAL